MSATYLDKANNYVADTCDPLREAADRGEVEFHALARDHYPGQRLPDGALPGLKSVGYWDASRKQQWGLDWHRNEGIEITCLKSGRLRFAADQLDFNLRKCSLTVTRPWQKHSIGAPNIQASYLHWLILDVDVRRPNQQWKWPDWIILSPDEISRLTHLLQYNEHPVWEGADTICKTFEQIATIVRNCDSSMRLSSLTLLVNQLLLELLELIEQNPKVVDPTLTSTRRSVALFLEGLRDRVDEEWTLDRMAMACGLNRTQFASYCKDITNMTPQRYLTECRLQMAKTLLVQPNDLSITEIAMQCGFNSSQYFSSVFKREAGLAPSQFALPV